MSFDSEGTPMSDEDIRRFKEALAQDTPQTISEEKEQVRFVAWFRKTFPHHLIFAIPNGGKRDAVTANHLKAQGAVAGIPDLFIPAWETWIEMKKKPGPDGRRPTTNVKQKRIMKYLSANGYRCFVCYGCEEAQAVVLALSEDRDVNKFGHVPLELLHDPKKK